jgi:ribosome-binding protein aMBF1 (putative translation factor)
MRKTKYKGPGRPPRPILIDPEGLYEARYQAGYCQEDLAKAMKISTRTLRRWEHGEFGPTERQARKLAKLLGDTFLKGAAKAHSCPSD